MRQEQEKDVPEHKIELLSLAAESLKTDLHFERPPVRRSSNAWIPRYMPILSQHPLFFSLQGIAEDVMRRFCHTAISRPGAWDIGFSSFLCSSGCRWLPVRLLGCQARFLGFAQAIITNETTLVQ